MSSDSDSDPFSDSGSSYHPDYSQLDLEDEDENENNSSFTRVSAESENANSSVNSLNDSLNFEDATITCESLVKTRSDSGVWNNFGQIKKNGILVTSFEHKLWCKLCFAKKQLMG